MAWEDGFTWKPSSKGGQYDLGNRGDFGGADYMEALRRGGTSRKELEATRSAVKAWMEKTDRMSSADRIKMYGQDNIFQGPLKGWVTKGTNIGFSGYGDHTKTKDETDDTKKAGFIYGQGDMWADLAQGRSYRDIRKHFTSNVDQLARFKKGGNIFKTINERAESEFEDEWNKGKSEEVGALKGQIGTLKTDYAASQKGFKSLQTKYDTELQDLKRAQMAVRSNSPTEVQGPGSAVGVKFAQSPTLTGKGGFRGTLSGRTRPTKSPAKKLATVNV